MDKQVFLTELAEALEVEDLQLKEDTVFTDLEEFDSMAIISIVAFVDEKFGEQLSAEKLKKMETVKDLMAIIGFAHFK